ncbi:Aspartic proteinase-like protein 2 [Platanthera guangdongensis]|uniref:Aspartic proteinase-like protein 2 n=1 Tax=Platanthera guangdongensis TaxID=2320717 RepID=A0ABR2MZZ1_9ASPA
MKTLKEDEDHLAPLITETPNGNHATQEPEQFLLFVPSAGAFPSKEERHGSVAGEQASRRNGDRSSNPASGVVGDGFQLTMELERGVPARASLEALRTRDRARHRRILQATAPSNAGVVDFLLRVRLIPSPLYFTRVKLGNPAKEFYVQIDTGSDILWVTCNPCNGCPSNSGLNYGDGSGTSGYYVSDTLYFDTVIANEQTSNSSATIAFGCSNSQSGDLTKSDRAVDGIFGFGQHGLSVISQLSSAGVSPKVFSHCLKGSDNGGGILVLGEIVEPDIDNGREKNKIFFKKVHLVEEEATQIEQRNRNIFVLSVIPAKALSATASLLRSVRRRPTATKQAA